MQPYISTYSDLRRGTRLCFFRPFHRGGPPDKENFFRRPPRFPAVKPRSSSSLDAAAKAPWRTKNRADLDAGCVRRSAACVHPWCSMYVYWCGGSWCGDVVMWRGWDEGGVLTSKAKEGESGGLRVGGVGQPGVGELNVWPRNGSKFGNNS